MGVLTAKGQKKIKKRVCGCLRWNHESGCEGTGGRGQRFIHHPDLKRLPRVCQICSREDGQLVGDHDHETNQPRGILCNRCNLAIGILGDTADGVARAVKYLRRYERTRMTRRAHT